MSRNFRLGQNNFQGTVCTPHFIVYFMQFLCKVLNNYKPCVTGILEKLGEDILSVSIFMDGVLKKLLKSMFSLQENGCINVS